MKKNHLIFMSILTVAVTAIVITAFNAIKQDSDNDRFSVTGAGIVYAKADIANIQIGLKTEVKKTAAEATQESTVKMNNIVQELKKLGLEDKDIKTSNYNLNPSYNWSQDKGQELIGYEVNQNLSLKIRDLSKMGDIIAKTTEQGANQIGSISFTIDDEYELKNQARELAINKAKEKAELIAAQSGMKLGDIKSFYESSNPVVSPMMYANVKMEAMDSVGGRITSPEIQSGQNEVNVEVTLVYEVK